MKKDIMELVNCRLGIYKLNNVCYLKRWTKDALNEDVDYLVLYFYPLNNVDFSFSATINARDYEGIMEECDDAIEDYFSNVTFELTKSLKAGYRWGV